MANAEARFNKPLRPRKPEASLGRTAQDGHLDSHTAPELCVSFHYHHWILIRTFVTNVIEKLNCVRDDGRYTQYRSRFSFES